MAFIGSRLDTSYCGRLSACWHGYHLKNSCFDAAGSGCCPVVPGIRAVVGVEGATHTTGGLIARHCTRRLTLVGDARATSSRSLPSPDPPLARRAAAPCEAGTAGPAPHRVVKGSQPTQCHTLGLARGSGPFEPPTGESAPLAPPSPRRSFFLSHDRGLDGAGGDSDEGVWSIPAPRTKGNRDYRVPLCRRALEVLDEARALSRSSPLVFPSFGGKPIGNTVMSELLRELNVAAVPHGFRSSFRDRGPKKQIILTRWPRRP